MADIRIQRVDMARDKDSWTDSSVDPEDADQCRWLLKKWCKDNRQDPNQHLIRVRENGRHGWTEYTL